MSNFITTARSEVTTALSKALDGVPVLDTMPETLYPPAVIVSEDTPFIAPSNTMGTWDINFEILAVVAPSSDNSVMLTSLDALVSQIVESLAPHFTPTVSVYTTETPANDQPLLGARITLTSSGWSLQKG